MAQKAVFLDRDGVINIDTSYISSVAEFTFCDRAIEALQILHSLGYALIVVTNQSGIARGYFTAEDLTAIHQYMITSLAQHHITLTGIYHCPHHPEITGVCSCRKPEPGMLLQAVDEHDLDLAHAYMVGDKASDLAAGQRAGIHNLVQITPQGSECSAASHRFDSLYDFAKHLAAQYQGAR